MTTLMMPTFVLNALALGLVRMPGLTAAACACCDVCDGGCGCGCC